MFANFSEGICVNEDETREQLRNTVRDALQLEDEAEIDEAVQQIETAFSRALLFVPLDDAPSIANQRKILAKLTPEDFRLGNPIDDAVRVRVGMHLRSGIFDLFTNDELPDDLLLASAIASAHMSISPPGKGRPTGTESLATRQLARELAKIWHEWTSRMPARAVFLGKDSEYREGGPFHRFMSEVLATAPHGLRKARKGVMPKPDSFVRLAQAELAAAYASGSEVERMGLLSEQDWLGKKPSS
jgi:hypothetical protein